MVVREQDEREIEYLLSLRWAKIESSLSGIAIRVGFELFKSSGSGYPINSVEAGRRKKQLC